MTLEFKNSVVKSFDFLQSDHSFSCVNANEYSVRYESDTVFVSVRFDNGRSFELDVEIGLRGVLYDGQERPFNLGEVLRLKGVEEKEGYTFLQASTQQRLENAINRLSSLLKLYATDLLDGNRFVFKSLADLRLKEGEEYALKRDLKLIRSEVKKAWKEKDFAKVVNLYSPIKSHITAAEKKKLEYAEKHKLD